MPGDATPQSALSADDRARLTRAATAASLRVEELSRTVTAAIVRGQPSLVEAVGATASDVIGRATLANVGAILSTLGHGVSPAGLDVPEGALDLLDHLAIDEAALPEMLRAYRLGAAAFNLVWVAELTEHAEDTAQLTRLVSRSLDHVATYVDRISEVIVERWSAVVEAAQRSGRRREAALRALLRGEAIDPALLDHPLDVPQLVVAWRAGGGRSAESMSGVLTTTAGTTDALELDLADGTSLTWLACPQAARRLPAVLDAAAGGGWLVATVAEGGVDALGQAAIDVREGLSAILRTRPEGAAAAHAEVALLATLLTDEPRARRLVATALGPLADGTPRSRELCETLRAYFAARERKVGAGALLGVHEKTVAYRLERIEETLGVQIHERRVELETALLLREAFI